MYLCSLGFRLIKVLTDLKRIHGMHCGEPSFSFKSCFISVVQDRQILNCSGSGDPELLRLILVQTSGIAGDRPPRYGKKDDFPRREPLILQIP